MDGSLHSRFSDWGPRTFGDPCAECGYGWSLPSQQAIATVSTIPERLQRIVGLREDSPTHPSLTWSAKAYVCHIADNLRIWAERLEAGLRGDGGQLASYDDNLLAVARGYEQVSWRVAWVALEWSVSTWVDTAERVQESGLTLHHPDRGPLTAADVIASNCHDASHHLWDVSRIVEHAGRLQTE